MRAKANDFLISLQTVKIDDVLTRMLRHKELIGQFFTKLNYYIHCKTVEEVRFRLEIDDTL